jgi:hypothetical protein
VPAPDGGRCIPAVPSGATGSGERRPRTVQRKSAADNEVARKTNRRVITRRRICLPAHGKSATCLSYRLWIRRDLAPHNGHSAMPPSDRAAKIIESDESLTLSITNPLGTSDEIRTPARMALIPRWRTASSAKKSSDVSQTQSSTPIDSQAAIKGPTDI